MSAQEERDVLAKAIFESYHDHQKRRVHGIPVWDYVATDLIAAGFHLTPTAEVKAEALAQIIEPLLDAHGTKARNSYYVECHCGCSEMGSYLGEKPNLHEHKAQVIAKAIAAHLRENGGDR